MCFSHLALAACWRPASRPPVVLGAAVLLCLLGGCSTRSITFVNLTGGPLQIVVMGQGQVTKAGPAGDADLPRFEPFQEVDNGKEVKFTVVPYSLPASFSWKAGDLTDAMAPLAKEFFDYDGNIVFVSGLFKGDMTDERVVRVRPYPFIKNHSLKELCEADVDVFATLAQMYEVQQSMASARTNRAGTSVSDITWEKIIPLAFLKARQRYIQAQERLEKFEQQSDKCKEWSQEIQFRKTFIAHLKSLQGEAMVRVGERYEFGGEGVEVNELKAAWYYMLACDMGSKLAQPHIDNLRKNNVKNVEGLIKDIFKPKSNATPWNEKGVILTVYDKGVGEPQQFTSLEFYDDGLHFEIKVSGDKSKKDQLYTGTIDYSEDIVVDGASFNFGTTLAGKALNDKADWPKKIERLWRAYRVLRGKPLPKDAYPEANWPLAEKQTPTSSASE